MKSINEDWADKAWLSQDQNAKARKKHFCNKHEFTGVKVMMVSVMMAACTVALWWLS